MSRDTGRKARHAKSCSGKIRHASKADALAALGSLIRRGGTAYGVQAYRCLACRSWHWGHIPGIRKR